VLSKGKKVSAAADKSGHRTVAVLVYLQDLRAEGNGPEDYLVSSSSPGVWFNPTGRFALHGEVKEGEFINLLSGRHPYTGSPWGRRFDVDRLGGMEFVCSAPKDFSVLWSAGNADQREELMQAHNRAVLTMLNFLVASAARSRKGRSGRLGLVRAHVIAALFSHKTSREADPQVHVHIVFANLAIVGPRLRALEFREFLKWRGAASAIYRVALAAELRKLGVRVERTGRNFILPDVPRELVSDLSQRRRTMRRFHRELIAFLRAAEEGPPMSASPAIRRFLRLWAKARKPRLDWRTLRLDDEDDTTGYSDAVALATRRRKLPINQLELETAWARKRAKYDFTIDQVLGKAPILRPSTAADRARVTRSAIRQLAAGAAMIEEREVIRVVAEHAQGELDIADVHLAVSEATLRGDLIALGQVSNGRMFSTVEALKRERRIIQGVQRRSLEAHHEIAGKHFDAMVAELTAASDDCKHALAYSAQGRGVGIVHAPDIPGRIEIVKVVSEMHSRAGYDVFVCAPTKRAVAKLVRSGIQACTVEAMLQALLDSVRRVQKNICILMADARRISSAIGEELLNAAERLRAKVLLAGDRRQVLPIAAAVERRERRISAPIDTSTTWTPPAPATASQYHGQMRLHVFDYVSAQRMDEMLHEKTFVNSPPLATTRSVMDLMEPLPPMNLAPKIAERLQVLRRDVLIERSSAEEAAREETGFGPI